MKQSVNRLTVHSKNTVTPYYEHAGITIYHGDCRDVMPCFTEPVDLVVTSPPYNCGMAYGSWNDSMPQVEYWSFIEEAYHAIAAVVGSGGFAALDVPSWVGSREERTYAIDEYRTIFDRHLPFWDLALWDKGPPNGTAWGNYPTTPMLRSSHEWIVINRAPGESRGPSDISWQDWARFTESVWRIQTTLPDRASHPATFPIEVPRRLISLYSPARGVVLDPFMGIGTTLIAAKRLGRRAIGVDVDERSCAAAVRLLAQDNLPLGNDEPISLTENLLGS